MVKRNNSTWLWSLLIAAQCPLLAKTLTKISTLVNDFANTPEFVLYKFLNQPTPQF